MSKRSTVLIAIGITVFVLGAGLVLVSLKGHGSRAGARVAETADTHSPPPTASPAVTGAGSSEAAVAAPSGYESMALTVNGGAQSLAGYLEPGSKVDIYANVVKQGGSVSDTPCVELVQPDVEVLDVSDVVPPYRAGASSAGRAVPGSITVLVALTPAEVPRVLYFTDDEQQTYLVASNATRVTPSGACYYLNPGGGVALGVAP